MSNSIKFQSAYTLLELLVALVVVSILTAVAIPAFGNYIQNAKINNAILDIKSIDAAIERRFSDNPNLPDSLSDIFNNVPVDPWGNPYRYLRIQGGDPANNGQKRKDHCLLIATTTCIHPGLMADPFPHSQQGTVATISYAPTTALSWAKRKTIKHRSHP